MGAAFEKWYKAGLFKLARKESAVCLPRKKAFLLCGNLYSYRTEKKSEKDLDLYGYLKIELTTYRSPFSCDVYEQKEVNAEKYTDQLVSYNMGVSIVICTY